MDDRPSIFPNPTALFWRVCVVGVAICAAVATLPGFGVWSVSVILGVIVFLAWCARGVFCGERTITVGPVAWVIVIPFTLCCVHVILAGRTATSGALGGAVLTSMTIHLGLMLLLTPVVLAGISAGGVSGIAGHVACAALVASPFLGGTVSREPALWMTAAAGLLAWTGLLLDARPACAPARRVRVIGIGFVFLFGVVTMGWLAWDMVFGTLPGGMLGKGEAAWAFLSAQPSGGAILVGHFGGLCAMVMAAMVCCWGITALRFTPKVGATLCFAAGFVFALIVWLSPGGYDVPASMWGVLLLGGLFGAKGSPGRSLPNGVLVGVVGVFLATIGLGPYGGLTVLAPLAAGHGDAIPHLIAGVLITAALGFASCRSKFFYPLLLAGVLLGGAAEGLQQLVGTRTPEWSDWGAHALGALATAVVLIVARHSRTDTPPAQRSLRPLVVGATILATLMVVWLVWLMVADRYRTRRPLEIVTTDAVVYAKAKPWWLGVVLSHRSPHPHPMYMTLQNANPPRRLLEPGRWDRSKPRPGFAVIEPTRGCDTTVRLRGMLFTPVRDAIGSCQIRTLSGQPDLLLIHVSADADPARYKALVDLASPSVLVAFVYSGDVAAWPTLRRTLKTRYSCCPAICPVHDSSESTLAKFLAGRLCSTAAGPGIRVSLCSNSDGFAALLAAALGKDLTRVKMPTTKLETKK